jgi:hypothetical protein
MSIRVMSEVWRTNLPTTEKMVLLVIADHANDEGIEAWPSQATIAKKASISIRTVQRCVNNLVKANYLKMEKRAGGSATCREDRRPHRYTINLNRVRGDSVAGRKRGDTNDGNGATSTTSTGRQPRLMKHTNKPPLETPSQLSFNDFWKIYPRKVAKAEAKKAWDKAIKNTPAEDILAGVQRYAQDPYRQDLYTAHPTTWLNQERWGDDPLPPRPLTEEEKLKKDLERARAKTDKEREDSKRWFAEQEALKKKAVPPPKDLRKLLYK